MKTINAFYGITVDISDELVKKYSMDLQGYSSLSQKLEKFAELDAVFIRHFLRVNGKYSSSKIRMLESHGNSLNGNGFLYSDLIDNKLVWYPVNDWIRKYDGKYDILYISSCNEGKIELNSIKSTLVYPSGKFRGSDLNRFYFNAIKNLQLIISEPKR